MTERNQRIGLAIATLSAGAFLLALARVDWSPADLFLTPDQHGQALMERKDYAGAAAVFENPLRRGVARYRAGDFEAAATAFGRDDTPEGLYNRANAMLMLGNYEAAIDAYNQALISKPDWLEARENLALARRRQQRLQAPNGGDEGTGGFLPPDEIVFDKRATGAPGDQNETMSGGLQALSDEALRAMWLRRVQTRPADFLRAKFSVQAAHQETSGHANDPGADRSKGSK